MYDTTAHLTVCVCVWLEFKNEWLAGTLNDYENYINWTLMNCDSLSRIF